MTGGLSLLWPLSIRPLCRDRKRSLLSVLGIALGVTLVFSVHLSTSRARDGIRQGGSFMNRADWEIVSYFNRAFDDRVYGRLLEIEGMTALPVVQRFVRVESIGKRVPFIATDSVKIPYFLDEYKAEVTDDANVFDSDSVLLSQGLAEKTGTEIGETLPLEIGSGSRRVRIAGVVQGGGLSDDAVLADIGAAQEMLGSHGRIDSIQIRMRNGYTPDRVAAAVRAALPEDLYLRKPSDRILRTREVFRAFEYNLKALSFMALLIGMFLVYNTIRVSVARRRSEVGILRALGMGRGGVMGLFVLEAVAIGIPGALLGVVAGNVVSIFSDQGVADTLLSLYGVPLLADAGNIAREAAWPFFLGVTGAVVSSLPPAYEATRVAPAETVREGSFERRYRDRVGRQAAAGSLLVPLGLALSFGPTIGRFPYTGFGGILVMTAGFVLASGWLIQRLAGSGRRFLGRTLGAGGTIGAAHLFTSAPRTAPAVSAISVSLACTLGILMLITSFRTTVEDWVDRNLSADLFVTENACGGRSFCEEAIAEPVVERLRALPGVTDIYRFRGFDFEYQGLSTHLAVSDTALLQKYDRFRFLPGPKPDDIYRELASGPFAIVSEAFSYRFGISTGDAIAVPAADGARNFTVSGIFYDYFSEQGYVLLDRRFLRPLFGVDDAHSLALYFDPEADRESVMARVTETLRAEDVGIARGPDIKARVLHVFDQTFFVTRAVYLVSLVIALLGVVSTLYTLVLERRRALSVLRYLGMDRLQLGKMVAAETGLIALSGSGIGAVMGLCLGIVLIYVVNKQSFGWSIDLHMPWLSMAGMMTGMAAATIGAAVLPYRELLRIRPEGHISAE